MGIGNPTLAEVPPVDLLTYAFEGEKSYDQNKVRGILPSVVFVCVQQTDNKVEAVLRSGG
jgi:hypothetical protein